MCQFRYVPFLSQYSCKAGLKERLNSCGHHTAPYLKPNCISNFNHMFIFQSYYEPSAPPPHPRNLKDQESLPDKDDAFQKLLARTTHAERFVVILSVALALSAFLNVLQAFPPGGT